MADAHFYTKLVWSVGALGSIESVERYSRGFRAEFEGKPPLRGSADSAMNESRKERAGDGRHGNVPDGVDVQRDGGKAEIGLSAAPWSLLVLGGVLIFIEPRALVWLLAGTSIFIGLVMLFFAMFVRKMSARSTNASR